MFSPSQKQLFYLFWVFKKLIIDIVCCYMYYLTCKYVTNIHTGMHILPIYLYHCTKKNNVAHMLVDEVQNFSLAVVENIRIAYKRQNHY